MKKMWNAPFILLLILGCDLSTGGGDDSSPRIESPSLQKAIGTWAITVYEYDETGQAIEEEMTTITVDENGKTTRVNTERPIGGETDYERAEYRGTISFDGNRIRLTETAERSSEGQPFSDPEAGWETYEEPEISETPAFFVDGRLYIGDLGAYIYSAAGDISGLIGTWETEVYFTRNSPAYTKSVFAFGTDGSVIRMNFKSDTETFPEIPTSTMTLQYELTGSNGLTLYRAENDPLDSISFTIVDTYLFLHYPPEFTSAAMVKQ